MNQCPISKTCVSLTGNQFARTMEGDRFFFTHSNGSAGFGINAKELLMSRTLSGVLCDNTGIQKVPIDAFRYTSTENFIDCSKTAKLDNDMAELLKNYA